MQPLALAIDPVAKPRMTQADKWKKRKATDRYWQYKDLLRTMVQIAPGTESDPLSLTFIIAMPNSWSEKKKLAYDGEPHMQKPDLDNLIKGFKDALWDNDAVVYQYGPMLKVWGRTGAIIVN